MKQKVYYKVVDAYDRSCIETDNCVYYKVGQWVKPSIAYSKLFVFSDLTEAKIFAGLAFNVYECIVKNPHTMCYATNWTIDSSSKEKFWRMKKNKKRAWHLMSITRLPAKTVICDAVKLLKCIV